MHAQGVVPPVRLSGGHWSAEQLAPPAPHVTECTRWLHARPPRNSAIHARESALYRARCSGRALRNEDAGCISCALRSVWRSDWSFSLVGRADAVRVCAYSRRDESAKANREHAQRYVVLHSEHERSILNPLPQ